VSFLNATELHRDSQLLFNMVPANVDSTLISLGRISRSPAFAKQHVKGSQVDELEFHELRLTELNLPQ